MVNVMIDMTERERVKQELEQRVDRRTHELEALLKIHRQVTNLEVKPLLNLVLTQLNKVVAYHGAAIITLDEEAMTVLAFQGEVEANKMVNWQIPLKDDQVIQAMVKSQKPIIIANLRDETDYARAFRQTAGERMKTVYRAANAWLGVPLITKGKVTGLLSLFHIQPDYYASYHAELVQAFAHHVAAALETDWLCQQVHQLATLTERERLARSLHDRLAQTLGYINIKTSLIQEQLANHGIAEANNDLRELKLITRETYTDVREAIFNLRTKIEAGRDFLPMLRDYIAEYELQHRISTQLVAEASVFDTFSPQTSTQLFYIIQEALSNVRKHAQASKATIRFMPQEDWLRLVIKDNGCGFDLATLTQGKASCFGLEIMRERIESVGGHLEIDTALQQGTCLMVWIPTHKNENRQG